MARGFESKSVAEQQEAALAPRAERPFDDTDPALLQRRRRLELARVDVLAHLERAQADAHRETLRLALAALDEQLESLAHTP